MKERRRKGRKEKKGRKKKEGRKIRRKNKEDSEREGQKRGGTKVICYEGGGVVPADWTKAIIVPVYKGKGRRGDCGSYRG